MRRKSGWEREREGEGGRENLRLDGVSPALSLTFANPKNCPFSQFGCGQAKRGRAKFSVASVVQ
jgi:hypothetical protein